MRHFFSLHGMWIAYHETTPHEANNPSCFCMLSPHLALMVRNGTKMQCNQYWCAKVVVSPSTGTHHDAKLQPGTNETEFCHHCSLLKTRIHNGRRLGFFDVHWISAGDTQGLGCGNPLHCSISMPFTLPSLVTSRNNYCKITSETRAALCQRTVRCSLACTTLVLSHGA